MRASSTLDPALVALAERQRRQGALVLGVFAGFLCLAFLLSVGWGAVSIAPGRILAILGDAIGLSLPWEFTRQEQAILFSIRLPRACLAILVGAALALSGAALQGLFRNPLADPALIGVSSGAALAAVGFIVFGATLTAALPAVIGPLLLPLAAFLGGLLATLLVQAIARHNGRTDVATLLLAGVALNAITSAAIGLMVFVSTDQQLRDLNFWLLGSLAGVTWGQLLPALPFIAAAAAALPLLAPQLNALVLGESEARHLGFNLERNKRLIVVLVALSAGASVALTGVIGFVGLVVPHLTRMIVGPDHRVLMPAAALLGAGLLLVADLAARTLVLPAELPIGVLTSCTGGPFFLWLLLRQKAKRGW